MVYSQTARTSPIIRDLKRAGRIDILLHSIISSLFASNTFRDDVELHLFLMGPPNAPRHIILKFDSQNSISKKDLKKLIEMCLRRAKKGKTLQVHPGVFVDDKTIEKVLEDFKEFYLLDQNGKNVREEISKAKKDFVFVLGDHEGFDKKTRKYLKKNGKRISLGPQIYFTSQAITILNYELDNS